MLFWFWSFPQLHFTKYHFCGDISPPLCLGLTLLILGKGTMGQRNQHFLNCLLLILMESHFGLFELSFLCGTGHSPYRCCVGWFWGECCVLFTPLCHWISTSLLEKSGGGTKSQFRSWELSISVFSTVDSGHQMQRKGSLSTMTQMYAL